MEGSHYWESSINFYPRPPRGGRLDVSFVGLFEYGISIHALREEGDGPSRSFLPGCRYFYPRPPRGGRHITPPACAAFAVISIHALREEGDVARCGDSVGNRRFLSTPSARRATGGALQRHTRQDYFYPRPPRGGRLAAMLPPPPFFLISIHALREEGDGSAFPTTTQPEKFLSTPSARRATAKTEKNISAFVSL